MLKLVRAGGNRECGQAAGAGLGPERDVSGMGSEHNGWAIAKKVRQPSIQVCACPALLALLPLVELHSRAHTNSAGWALIKFPVQKAQTAEDNRDLNSLHLHRRITITCNLPRYTIHHLKSKYYLTFLNLLRHACLIFSAVARIDKPDQGRLGFEDFQGPDVVYRGEQDILTSEHPLGHPTMQSTTGSAATLWTPPPISYAWLTSEEGMVCCGQRNGIHGGGYGYRIHAERARLACNTSGPSHHGSAHPGHGHGHGQTRSNPTVSRRTKSVPSQAGPRDTDTMDVPELDLDLDLDLEQHLAGPASASSAPRPDPFPSLRSSRLLVASRTSACLPPASLLQLALTSHATRRSDGR
ncbi:hypothetical protein CPLU01_03437 [Colletotrichum plurivorum]|uniref:Uncharacterized protein n=1 Tax=Colletotrichum plurivorum TaxID=2175906 RepID=A0A8H6KT89_9PEZI|nr:hypothetical protein CPLU01_03437 [Colletotrichum plurivorum]